MWKDKRVHAHRKNKTGRRNIPTFTGTTSHIKHMHSMESSLPGAFLPLQDSFTSMVGVFLVGMVLALQHCWRAQVERWSAQAAVLLKARRFSWITVVFEGMEVLPLSADQWLQWNRIRKHS